MTIFTCEPGMRVVCFCLILFFYCKYSVLLFQTLWELRPDMGQDLDAWSGSSECLPGQNGGRSPWLPTVSCPSQWELLLPGERATQVCSATLQGILFPRHSVSWSQQASSGPAVVTHVPTSCGNAAEERPLLYLAPPWLKLSWDKGKFAYETFSSLGWGLHSHLRRLCLPGSCWFCQGVLPFGSRAPPSTEVRLHLVEEEEPECLIPAVGCVFSGDCLQPKLFLDQQLDPRFPFFWGDCPHHWASSLFFFSS